MIYESKNIVLETYPQIIATFFGSLIAISDGLVYGFTSPMIPYLTDESRSHILMTIHEAEWLETIALIGAITGLPFTIYFVDKIGRKNSMLLSTCVSICAWLLILFGDRVEYLYVARFFGGMAGDMCFVATPMYIAEIAHPKIRGFLSSLIYLMMLLGIFIVYTVGAYAPFFVTPCIGLVLTISELLVFSFMPESPYYFIYKNQPEKAKKALSWLRNKTVDIDQELKYIAASVEQQKTERGRPQDIFLIPSNRKAFFIMLLLNAGQHFTGISVMLMNIQIILTEGGSIYIDSSLAAVLFAIVMITSASIASTIIDRFGRKILLLSSGITTALNLLVLTIYFQLKYMDYDVESVSWIPIVCVLLYGLFFKFGLGLVPIVVTGEVFPTTMKAIGMTLSDVIYVFASLLSVWIYQWMYHSYGIHTPFWLFTICTIFVTILTRFFVPETKGKTLDEIQTMLKGG